MRVRNEIFWRYLGCGFLEICDFSELKKRAKKVEIYRKGDQREDMKHRLDGSLRNMS
jgi:hypothetical protein